MDKTAIQAGTPPTVHGHANAIQASAPAPRPTAVTEVRPAKASKPLAMRILLFAADLRITVVLFTLSLFLVFYGTLAQIDKGVWTVVSDYFRSAIVWIPLKTVFFRTVNVSGSIPYPGGWLLGGLLLVNLLAAHIVSFKLTWRRTGIWMIHSGIVLMMVGEVITGCFQLEGQMRISLDESTNVIEYPNAPELAIIDVSDYKTDHVTVIPTARLRRGELISDERLPFDVEVVRYMVNSDVVDARAGDTNDATAGQGLKLIARDRPEGVGVDQDQKIDLASAYVTLRNKKTGESLGTYMVSVLASFAVLQPERVVVDGKPYDVTLRFKQSHRPYTFRLDKLNVEFYQNTDVPKDYSSFIHLTDPEGTPPEKDVRIWMNNPLTYRGETFYQSGVHQDEMNRWRMTTLQVVSNPGWALPYLSCLLVASGMLFHFGLNLSRFIQRRAV